MNDVLEEINTRSRVQVFRIVGLMLAVGLVVFTASVVGVVQFALDGVPLAGNAVRVADRPVVAWAGLGLAVTVPLVAVAVSRAVIRTGIDAVADDRAVPPGSPAEAQRLLDAFGGATFVRYAMTEGTGIICALAYHVTADPVLLLGVAGLVAFILASRPTMASACHWYETAIEQAADRRREKADV